MDGGTETSKALIIMARPQMTGLSQAIVMGSQEIKGAEVPAWL